MSVSEIIGTLEDGSLQVCASAEASYDPAERKVAVALKAFTRRASVGHDGVELAAPWLPAPEQVSEHLERSEADEFVKDVFHSWVKKVRTAIPPNQSLRS